MRYLVTGAGSRTDAWGSYNGDEDVKLLYRSASIQKNVLAILLRYPKRPDVSLLHARYIQQRNEFGFGYGGFVHFSVGEHRADLSFYAKVSFSKQKSIYSATFRIWTLNFKKAYQQETLINFQNRLQTNNPSRREKIDEKERLLKISSLNKTNNAFI